MYVLFNQLRLRCNITEICPWYYNQQLGHDFKELNWLKLRPDWPLTFFLFLHCYQGHNFFQPIFFKCVISPVSCSVKLSNIIWSLDKYYIFLSFAWRAKKMKHKFLFIHWSCEINILFTLWPFTNTITGIEHIFMEGKVGKLQSLLYMLYYM